MLSFAFIAISASIATRLPTISAESLQRELWATPGRDLFKTDIHAILHCGNGAPRFRLMYLPVRNRGEVPRLIMEEAKCAYEIEVVGFSQWEQYVKAGTPFGKCPVLRDFDGGGTDLANELAITRWLAQRCGLAGRSVAEQALVDSVHEQLWCTLRNQGVSHDGEHYSALALRECEDAAATLEATPRYQEIFRREAKSLPRAVRSLAALRVFEERLASSQSGWLVGEGLTYVDIALFEILDQLSEPDQVPDFAERFELPQLGAFLERMEKRPQLREYLASDRRMPRYGRDASTGEGVYVYIEGKGAPARS